MNKLTIIIITGSFLFSNTILSAEHTRKNYQLTSQKMPVSIDGIIDEEAWQYATKMELAYENNPGEGVLAPVKTEIYFFEDGKSFNVAIKAFDPNPENIRASLRDRDALWADDNVGVIIDTFNDERSGYEFFVNPMGAQADMRMSDTNGWNEDSSWDAIWDSAAQITDYGYAVEMSIPFSALRFPETDGALTWNVAGWRNYPRDVRVQMATYKRNRNIQCNLCQFDQLEGFEQVKAGNNFQLTPTLTIARSDDKPQQDLVLPNGDIDENNTVPGSWDNGSIETDPGLDVRWGITQDMVLNATINPDFSQVEADAGQLDVNNTFSLFYPEKRPFFLDGASYFDTSRFNFVHTRNISNPDYGLKVTGKSKDHSYGLMIANDNQTNFIVPDNQGSDIAELEQKSEVAIARYKVDVGERNNIGVLMTHRNAQDYNNTLVSVDGSYWFNDTDSIQYQAARSDSKNPSWVQDDFDIKEEQTGNAYSIGYSHETRDYQLRAGYNNVGDDFRADLGFHSQVGYERFVLGGRQTWYGESDDIFNRWGYFGDWDKTYDQQGNMLEQEIELHGNLQGQKQFYTNFGIVHRERFYDDEYFDETQAMAYASITPVSGLKFEGFTRFGKQIDFTNTRLGDIVNFEPEVRWDINEHIHVHFRHNYSQLDIDGEPLFTANQSDFRVGYQFDMRSILKLVIQYTDIKRDLDLYTIDEEDLPDERYRSFATQLVYSYKINPQTLFYLGFSDGGYQDDNIDKIVRDQRTIFTKFSYAWQL
ncbi:DUF5916 domain-containing protein [Colwelliaceae bacterium 6471]